MPLSSPSNRRSLPWWAVVVLLLGGSLLLGQEDCMADPPPSTSRHPLALDCVIEGSNIYIPLEPLAAPDRPYFTAGTGALVDASLTARLPADLFCALLDAGYTQVDLASATVAMSITAVTKPVPPEVALPAIGLPIPLIDTALACGGSLGAEIPLDFPPVTSIPWSDGGWTVDYLLTVGGIDFALTNLAPSGPDLSLTDLCQPVDRSVPVNGTTDDPEDSPRIAADKNGDGNYEAAATAQDQIQLPVNGWCAGYKCDDFNDCTIDTCIARAQWCTWDPEPDGTSCDIGGVAGVCDAGVCETGFPCTEQGILDAIALGGGPYTFACNGPTTVATQAEIAIDNDVMLDGEGNLTVDGNDDHRVFSVPVGVTAELVGVTVTGGFLSQDGERGAGVLNEGTLRIANSSVESNGTGARYGPRIEGGGIYNSGTLMLESSIVQGNDAHNGCGIHNVGTATLINSEVSQNGGQHGGTSAVSAGSGIYNDGGALTLVDTTVSLNASGQEDAAAINNHNGATLLLINSVVSDNYSVQSGSTFSMGSSATLINSTVSGNGSDGNVDGIEVMGGTLSLFSSTVEGGIGEWQSPFEFTVANSILGWCDLYDSLVTSGGGNIQSGGDSCGLSDPTDLVNVTPQDLNLGPLADNGGPTMTHALLPGSVAIDRIPAAMCVDAVGQPLTEDQRGVARPQGAMCDVGAFVSADCAGSVCDDGNDCTADHCNPLDYSWCAHTTLADGTSCEVDGVCNAGVCGPNACASKTADLSATAGWQASAAQTAALQSLTFTTYARVQNPGSSNGLIGIANQASSTFGDHAAIVRFDLDGHFDAYDGTGYCTTTCINTIPWVEGTWYKIMLTADIAAKTYTVDIGECDGPQQRLITNAAFRSTAPTTGGLDHYNLWHKIGTTEVQGVVFDAQ